MLSAWQACPWEKKGYNILLIQNDPQKKEATKAVTDAEMTKY